MNEGCCGGHGGMMKPSAVDLWARHGHHGVSKKLVMLSGLMVIASIIFNRAYYMSFWTLFYSLVMCYVGKMKKHEIISVKTYFVLSFTMLFVWAYGIVQLFAISV